MAITMRRLAWCLLLLLFVQFPSFAQSLAEQKKTVTFIFATVHPLDGQKKPVLRNGKPIALDAAVGTGFFVSYPEPRGGPNYIFSYLVTNKHVLRDFDGTYFRKIRVRLNLLSPSGDKSFDLDTEVPVTDEQGRLLWFHTPNEADDVALFPLLPNQSKYDFKTVPTTMFVNGDNLKSDAVEEGDRLYFIGLMAQYYGKNRNYPVVREGNLALMTDETIATESGPQNVFIAQLESWPGNSGSPVFLNLGGIRGNTIYAGNRIRLLGIMVAEFFNKFSGSLVDNPDLSIMWGNDYNTGISLVIPAPRIAEILQLPEAKAPREIQLNHLQEQKRQ